MGKVATAVKNQRNCCLSMPRDRRKRANRSTTAAKAKRARMVPIEEMIGLRNRRAPGIPMGLLGGVSPSTGPGRNANARTSNAAKVKNARVKKRPNVVAADPVG